MSYRCELHDGTKICKLPDWLVPMPQTLIKAKDRWHIVVTVRCAEKLVILKPCWEPERMVNDYANRK